MSIPNLPVDFKDDILAASNPKRKYQQTFNSDGSVSLEDVTVYTQKGSDFGASQANQTNQAINNIYSERILDLDELELVTEPGFFVDALAVKELNSKIDVTVTRSAQNTNSNATYQCTYYPALGLVFFRAYVPSRPVSLAKGVESVLFTLADGPWVPETNYALYVHGGVNNALNARTNGRNITLTPRLQDLSADNIVSIGGFWFVG